MQRQRSTSPSGPVSAILVVVAAAGLSACTDPASLAMSGASVITFVSSGKTVTDHAMSFATDQDCSLKRSLDGGPWCQAAGEASPHAIAATEPLYCYRSIAEITCYRSRNPNDTKTRQTFGPGPAGPGVPELAEKSGADAK